MKKLTLFLLLVTNVTTFARGKNQLVEIEHGLKLNQSSVGFEIKNLRIIEKDTKLAIDELFNFEGQRNLFYCYTGSSKSIKGILDKMIKNYGGLQPAPDHDTGDMNESYFEFSVNKKKIIYSEIFLADDSPFGGMNISIEAGPCEKK